MYFGMLLALLAVGGGLLYRSRLGRVVRGDRPLITDELLRQIEAGGEVEIDEPLDHDEIREEEARFLDEYQWEEPDEP